MSNKDTTPTGLKFTVKEQVSVPDFQFEDNESEYFIRPIGPIFRAAEREDAPRPASSGPAPMGAPWKCRIIDLEDMQTKSALIPAMVRNHLSEAYPGDGYMNRDFKVVMHAANARLKKKYRTCDIAEIDLETGGESEVPEAT